MKDTPGASVSRYQRKLPAAESMTPIKCHMPGAAWQKACKRPSGSMIGWPAAAKTTPEVPEPATGVLLVMGSLFAFARRRGKKSS